MFQNFYIALLAYLYAYKKKTLVNSHWINGNELKANFSTIKYSIILNKYQHTHITLDYIQYYTNMTTNHRRVSQLKE